MNRDENFMGSMPVWKLVVKLAIPTVIITLVMAVYNMADVFFIGQTGNADMVNAISVCMPVFTIVQAFGTLVGSGGCVAISIALGKGETERTRSISAFCFWFCMALGVLLAVVMNVFSGALMDMLGAADSYEDYAVTYLRIIACGCPIMLFSNAFVNILRADGSIKESMIANLSGTFLNIVLDPILILGLKMDVAGAAIATVAGNLLSLIIVVVATRKKDSIVSYNVKKVSLKAENSVQVLGLGLPLAVGTLLISVSYMVMNNLLKGYDTNAQGAFGICRTIMLLSTMIQMGICMGTQPAVSYNFGLQKLERVKEVILKTGIVTISFGAIVSTLIILFRKVILSAVFDNSAVMLYAEKFIIGCLCTSVVYGLYQVCSTSLQAIKRSMWSTVITILRQGVVLVPAMLLLNKLFGLNGLVFCFAVTDVIVAVIGVCLLITALKTLKNSAPIIDGR